MYRCLECGYNCTPMKYAMNRCPRCGHTWYHVPDNSPDMSIYTSRLSIQKEGLVGNIQQINKKLLLLN